MSNVSLETETYRRKNSSNFTGLVKDNQVVHDYNLSNFVST